MTVLVRFMKDRRRSATGWITALVLFLGLQNALYPAFKDQMKNFQFGDDAGSFLGLGGASLSSPAGWLQGQVFGTLPILLTFFTVSLGTRALATSEEDGTLELLLANPVERRRVALERAYGLGILSAIVGLVTTGILLATTPPLGLTEGVSIPGFIAISVGSVAVALLFGAVAFAAGAFTGRRSVAMMAGGSLAAVTFVLNGLSATVDVLHSLRFISPFHWILGRNFLVQGVAYEGITLPFALAAAFCALGIWGFLRRDLQTS